MNGTPCNRRLATVALLLVCAVPPCAAAQEFVCWPIARGDTAPRLAHRLTGNSDAAYTDAFQIRDPARRLFVPKSQYRNLKAGWQACVANTTRKSPPAAFAPEVAPVAAAIVPKEPAITLWIAASFLLVVICTGVAALAAPNPIPPPLQRAGDAFV